MASCQVKVHLACVFLTLCSFALLESRRISVELLKYDQSESFFKCLDYLIEGMDVAVFKTIADLTEASIDWGRYIMYEIRTTIGERYVYEASLESCNNVSSVNVCYCELNDSGIYHVKCRFPAKYSLSEAKIRAKLSNVNGTHRLSTYQTFPNIFDVNLITIYGNERALETGQCNITVYTPPHQVKLYCEQAPSPCRISVWSNGERMADGDNEVLVITKMYKMFTVEYRVCNKTRRIRCNINYEAKDEQKTTAAVTSSQCVQDGSALIGFLISCFSILYYFKR